VKTSDIPPNRGVLAGMMRAEVESCSGNSALDQDR
jgi:hypothetical protein